ncbi:MAG: response regulator transcription factor [Xanthomonadales bacterium]|nr:response regulator transcription factor [Xanthomonadales bacterium]
MRILLIEDEAPLREELVGRMRAEGFAVDAAGDGEEGLYYGLEYPIDVAVVDLGLPKLSGMEVIARLREADRKFPILILTARDAWQEKVAGLEAGADDYLVKPFVIEELMARINALVRRSAGWARAELEAGPYKLDTAAQTLAVEGEPVELTSYEYKVLEYLLLHAGEVISKMRLTEHIYDEDFERDSNVIEVFIGRLRRKIDPDGVWKPIETLRGRGYRFRQFDRERA